MTYFLFLDDERQPSDVMWVKLPNIAWVIARTYSEFSSIIEENGVPKFVTFDHDLADEHYAVMEEENSYTHDDGDMVKTFNYGSEKTGYDCAKFLVDYCHDKNLAFPSYEIHSKNPVGAARIRNYISFAVRHGYITLFE